jgi:hypothetical protein
MLRRKNARCLYYSYKPTLQQTPTQPYELPTQQSSQGSDEIESIDKVASAQSDSIESIEHAESQEGELVKGSYVTWEDKRFWGDVGQVACVRANGTVSVNVSTKCTWRNIAETSDLSERLAKQKWNGNLFNVPRQHRISIELLTPQRSRRCSRGGVERLEPTEQLRQRAIGGRSGTREVNDDTKHWAEEFGPMADGTCYVCKTMFPKHAAGDAGDGFHRSWQRAHVQPDRMPRHYVVPAFNWNGPPDRCSCNGCG